MSGSSCRNDAEEFGVMSLEEKGRTMSTAAMVRHESKQVVEGYRFSEDERQLMLDTCCGGATTDEAKQLVAIAEMRGLNPLAGECFFVKRWDSDKQRNVWAVQTSIDSMRIKAEESGVYAGQDEPEYEYDPGSKLPKLARVKVWRRDWDRPCVGVARWDEYVQLTKDGVPTKFWKRMPHNQLAKCAEALALRKAFPRRFAKVYTPEEMDQASNQPMHDEPTVRHDELTGEVLEPEPAPKRIEEPTPLMQSTLKKLENAIEEAHSSDELKVAWASVGKAFKGNFISLKMLGQLGALKDHRKAKLKSEPMPGPSDVTDGNEAWGIGEVERQPGEEG